jgi:DNA-directed RNA polymerase specialized sigma24 family protein
MSARRHAHTVRSVDRTAALELLPEAYAEALRLREAGSEPAEIARRLEIAPEAVASALELAEAKLARLIAGASPSELSEDEPLEPADSP